MKLADQPTDSASIACRPAYRRRADSPPGTDLTPKFAASDHYIVRFYRAFPAGRCQPSHVSLFRRDGGASDLAAHLLGQDLVYVGGGSVISLLGTWTAHGLDSGLRAAWEAGVSWPA